MGLGVFAAQHLASGRFLDCYGGEMKTDSDVESSSSAYIFSVGSGNNIDAALECEGTNWTRYMNHGVPSNVKAVVCHGPASTHTLINEDGSWLDVQVPAGPRV